MNVKIDTKEKFTVITPNEADISANMTEDIKAMLLSFLDKKIPHIILNLKNVYSTDRQFLAMIVYLQEQFQNKSCSFVLCELTKPVKQVFSEGDLLDLLNLTPTESEAWDIVQMEEIEREFLHGTE